MRVAAHLVGAPLWLLCAPSPLRAPPPRCAEDDAEALRRASQVDIGNAGDVAGDALEALRVAREKRLESLGARPGPVPPPVPPSSAPRAAFQISNAAASQSEAEERLRRMRRKDTGELEGEHAEEIARAMRSSTQWLDAGLPDRALADLTGVEKLCSFKTDVGAKFHLRLAATLDKCGQSARAKLLRTRIISEAQASSLRWQAERAMSSVGGGTAKAPADEKRDNEYGNLFGGFSGLGGGF